MEKFGIECRQLMSKEIKERIKDAPHLFLSSFNAVSVSEQDQLRRKLKEIDASLFVIKNRIAKRTFQQENLELLTSLMQGMTSITMGGHDSVCVSKALVDFAGKHENFKILGAYVDEQLLDLNSIKRLAAIPSREVLLAHIVCGFKWPIQGLVNTLTATLKQFIVVLDKIREKQKEEK